MGEIYKVFRKYEVNFVELGAICNMHRWTSLVMFSLFLELGGSTMAQTRPFATIGSYYGMFLPLSEPLPILLSLLKAFSTLGVLAHGALRNGKYCEMRYINTDK